MEVLFFYLSLLLAVVKPSEQSTSTNSDLQKLINGTKAGSNITDYEKRFVLGVLDERNKARLEEIKNRAAVDKSSIVIKRDKILFHLHRKTDNGTTSRKILPIDIKHLRSKSFDENLETKVIIHGWLCDTDSLFPALMKDTLLKNKDMNLLVVDWSYHSQTWLYPESCYNSFQVAAAIGEFLSDLVLLKHVNATSLHIIGHSLGAHIAGLAGQKMHQILGQKVPWITGLDPAYPVFELLNTDWRLNSDAANFVDIVHTCGGWLGFEDPIGHIDFYPNGGSFRQPGCPPYTWGFCSHGRAYQFYAEALTTPNSFVGYPYEDLDSFRAAMNKGGLKRDGSKRMGEFYAGGRKYGRYFLDTRSKSPFNIENIKVSPPRKTVT